MPNKIIITPGDKIHFWTVIGESDIRNKQNKRQLIAKCACGTEKLLDARSLYGSGSRISQSCGCKSVELGNEKRKDVIVSGVKHNRLTILKEIDSVKAPNCGSTYRRVRCECECGDVRDYYYHAVKSGKTSSCGCYSREITADRSRTHGMCKTETYTSWQAMINRCNDVKHEAYHNYGGRGIKVCERWLTSFANFYEDMGERPSEYTLDRIHVNGDYEPGNCKWSSKKEQSWNKRNNRYVKYAGKTMNLYEWSEILNMNYAALWHKCNKSNWDTEKVFDELFNF